MQARGIGGLFGKRSSPAPPPQSPDDVLELSMAEVATYARALAAKRGYPADALDMIARRIAFLERRDLPGLGAFHRDLVLFAHEPLAARFRADRPDGRRGGQCPIAAGVMLDGELDAMTGRHEDDPAWFVAPSNSLLLVAKLAEWLRPTGRTAVIQWARGRQACGHAIVEGYRVAFQAEIAATQDAEHVGISGLSEELSALPGLRTGWVERVRVLRKHVDMMDNYLGGVP